MNTASRLDSQQRGNRHFHLGYVHSISKEKKDKFDFAVALAVYISARPFRLWKDRYFRQLISLLSDNLYTPPHCDYISRDLLDQTYFKVRHQVLDILHHESSL